MQWGFAKSNADWEKNLAVGRIMCFLWPLAIASACNLIEVYLLECSCLEKAYKHINLASVSACQYQVSAKMKDGISGFCHLEDEFAEQGRSWNFKIRGTDVSTGGLVDVLLLETRLRVTVLFLQTDWNVILFLNQSDITQKESEWFSVSAPVVFQIKHCYDRKSLLWSCICT